MPTNPSPGSVKTAAAPRPTSRDRRSMLRVVLPLLLVVASALPVLFLVQPPMVDVLGHIGRYSLQTGLDDHPWLRSYYSFRWQIIGNLGADLLVELTWRAIGLENAVRLAVVLIPLLATSAIVLLSREIHGRVTPFAVLAVTLIYGLPFTWGFLNFSLAMALALLAFVLWLRLTHGGHATLRSVLFVLLSLTVWTCHTFGWAFLGILCAAESLTRRAKADRTPVKVLLGCIRDGLALAAPLVPMLAWRSTASGAGVSGWFAMSQKAAWVVGILRLDWKWTDIACGCVLFVVVYVGVRSKRVAIDPATGLAAAMALAVFLLLPGQIFGSVFADMRLAPYVLMLALLAMRIEGLSGRTAARWMAAAVLFLVLRLALTTYVYREREQRVEQQMAALAVIPEHARVATLVGIPCVWEWDVAWFSHVGSLALARKHVFVNDQWANSSMNPLSVHYPAAGDFATDDRQLFYPARCNTDARRLGESLRALPAQAFTHVWIVGLSPWAIPRRADLVMVWHSTDAAVFAVRKAAYRGSPAH